MTRPTLVIVGAGGHARACLDVVEAEGRWAVAGFVERAGATTREVLGLPVLGTDDDLDALRREHGAALVALGQLTDPAPRRRLAARLRDGGWTLPTIVSPRAHVSRHARIGAGTIVMHDAIVNAGARVGANGILNTRVLVEHDVVVGDDCHLATGVILNGGVRVGDGVFVGSGTIVRPGVVLHDGAVVAMGQRVTRDCAAGAWLPPRAVAVPEGACAR